MAHKPHFVAFYCQHTITIIEESFAQLIIAFEVQKQSCQTKVSEIMYSSYTVE